MENAKKSILVVDDDKSILRTLKRIFQKADYQIEVAETGKEAVERIKEKKYDLALVDVKLPDIDGSDLLVKMRDELQNTVKIVFTGFPSIEVGTQVLNAGADAYLVKPIKPEELLDLVNKKLK